MFFQAPGHADFSTVSTAAVSIMNPELHYLNLPVSPMMSSIQPENSAKIPHHDMLSRKWILDWTIQRNQSGHNPHTHRRSIDWFKRLYAVKALNTCAVGWLVDLPLSIGRESIWIPLQFPCNGTHPEAPTNAEMKLGMKEKVRTLPVHPNLYTAEL